MSTEHTFQYIEEPTGLVHIRLAHSQQTLCAKIPAEDWKSKTEHIGALCKRCCSRIESFVTDVIDDGKKP